MMTDTCISWEKPWRLNQTCCVELSHPSGGHQQTSIKPTSTNVTGSEPIWQEMTDISKIKQVPILFARLFTERISKPQNKKTIWLTTFLPDRGWLTTAGSTSRKKGKFPAFGILNAKCTLFFEILYLSLQRWYKSKTVLHKSTFLS